MGTSLDLTSTLPQQHTSRRRPDPAKRTGHRRSRLPMAYAVLLDPRPKLMLLVVRVTTRTTASILYGTYSVAEVTVRHRIYTTEAVVRTTSHRNFDMA